MLKTKNIVELEINVIIQLNTAVLHILYSICNLQNGAPKEIYVLSHNESINDNHIIIKELEKEFNCLGENRKKCMTFSVPIEK